MLLILFSGATYAATNTSLWGSTSDTAIPAKKQIPPHTKSQQPPTSQTSQSPNISQEEQDLQIEQQQIANQKTICELLTDQSSLYVDKDNAAKIKDAIQYAYKFVLPDYKILLVNDVSANELYEKYRESYIKTYCMAQAPSAPATPVAQSPDSSSNNPAATTVQPQAAPFLK